MDVFDEGFNVGEVAVVTIDFSRAEVPVDPATIACIVRWRQEETTLDPNDIVSTGEQGVYTVRFTTDKSGDWYVRVEGESGEDVAVWEGIVRVPSSPFARDAVA